MILSIKNYKCTYTSHVFSLVFYLSVAKTREPKDKQLCIAVHTRNNNIYDADPLDNSSNKIQVEQQCLT